MVTIDKAINELRKIFKFFNQELFEGKLKEPTILIQHQGNNQFAYGWISCAEIWNGKNEEKNYELNICAEFLNRPLYEVCSTMLHEMVHLYNIYHEIQDTSRGNTYHNKKFKAEAEKRLLVIDFDKRIGHSITSCSDELIRLIDSQNFDSNVFSISREMFANSKGKGKKKSKSSSKKYICTECGLSIRATKEVRLTCTDCQVELIEEDK